MEASVEEHCGWRWDTRLSILVITDVRFHSQLHTSHNIKRKCFRMFAICLPSQQCHFGIGTLLYSTEFVLCGWRQKVLNLQVQLLGLH